MLVSEILTMLGRGAPHGHYWTRHNKRSVWYSTTEIPRPLSGDDLYFGVHPCGAIPPGKPEHVRSRNDFIGSVNCFYADVDFDKFPGGEEEARAYVEGLKASDTGPSPNLIVFTGGGFHIYHLLTQPITFTGIGRPDKVRDYVMLLQRKWVRLMGGDPGAKDFARLLRVPGSFNCKYTPARRVELVYADLSSLYELQDIDALVAPVRLEVETQPVAATTMERKTQPATQPARVSVIELYNQSTRIRDLLAFYGYSVNGNRFVRPGKTARDGISGTIRDDANDAYTFSSNDPAFDAGNTSPSGAGCKIRPFDLLVKLSFNGDAKAAVKYLAGGAR